MNPRCFSSKRGKDRCRHFVISSQKNGRYVISGDSHSHESLAELINYYQISEIVPFGENLTAPCSKLEEKNVYDEISPEQRAPAKPSSELPSTHLARQESRSSSAASPIVKDIPSQPSSNSRRKLKEQHKSLSKEKRAWSLEADLEDDLDEAPPIPDRSILLMAEVFEGASSNEAAVYAALKHPKDKTSEVLPDVDQVVTDHSQNLEDPGRGNPYRKNMSTKLPDKVYGKRTDLIESCSPATVYSEISIDQSKNTLPQSNPSFSLMAPKKTTLNSPTSTPPKLSPKLPNKPKTPTESLGLQQTPSALYSTSPKTGEGHRMPAPSETLSDSPRENLYGQIHKLKSQELTTSVSDDPYEQIPFEWAKRRAQERAFENLPRSSPLRPKEAYEQACMKAGRSSRTQSYTENTYEKIPAPLSKSSSSRQVATADNIYEKISFVPGKGTGAKPSQKSEKPRRFLFADKKNKF
ncbi:SH2 domain-containing protein 7 [Eublepharis macularius]|uniref:SH2 domain-containing protein 7 n=1 Tax=Eublepharis macularius TaxID=481883 RepID=A0AA97KMF3_EUBMA|nr:SH2 domain-containing protein 7 [Eublepharis macularius]